MVDRFSDLPDPLLLLILSLSLMNTRNAVQTSLYGKRWKNLWTSLSYLHFDTREFTSDEKFCYFVDTMLSCREKTRIDTFELWCREFRQRHYASIKRWICYALQHNTQVLRIDAFNSSVFPAGIFNCESLEELHLSSQMFQLDNIPYPATAFNLPRLRVLRLAGFGFWLVDGFLSKLLLGCPVLEEILLSMYRCDAWTISGSFSDKFKHSTVAKFPGTYIQSRSDRGYVQLYYSRSAEGLARLINLDLPSPIETNMFFHINQQLEIESYLSSILSGLSNVECLQLCMHIQKLKGFDNMDPLVLSSTLANLKHFSICGLFASDGFYYLSGLLQYMPNIEILTLQQSCKGCPFKKFGVDNWENPSCIVSTEKMEAWGNEILKCKKLKKIYVNFSNYNEKLKQKVYALTKCWRNFEGIEMMVMQ